MDERLRQDKQRGPSRFVARAVLGLLRGHARLRDKLASMLCSGAFESFGKRSVIALPHRLEGVERIAIGSACWFGPDSWLQSIEGPTAGGRIQVGDRVTASGSLVLSAASSIVVEDDVLFARNVYVSDHIHGYDDPDRPVHEQGLSKVAPVRIERGAWLGQNVVVCPGVTIGRGAVIGAGSVVNSDVPPHVVAVGAPARVVKTFAAGHEATASAAVTSEDLVAK